MEDSKSSDQSLGSIARQEIYPRIPSIHYGTNQISNQIRSIKIHRETPEFVSNP